MEEEPKMIDWNRPIETCEDPPRRLFLRPNDPKIGRYSTQGVSCPPNPRKRIARVATADPADPDGGMWFAEDGSPVGIAPSIRNVEPAIERTASPRAGRSHCFDIHEFCVFCRHPMTYFAENGFGYCSSAWTGRPANRSATNAWLFGPFQWIRVGTCAMARVGPVALYIIGRKWKIGFV